MQNVVSTERTKKEVNKTKVQILFISELMRDNKVSQVMNMKDTIHGIKPLMNTTKGVLLMFKCGLQKVAGHKTGL